MFASAVKPAETIFIMAMALGIVTSRVPRCSVEFSKEALIDKEKPKKVPFL